LLVLNLERISRQQQLDNGVNENRNGRPFRRCRICRREAQRSWQKQNSSPDAGPKSQKSKPAKKTESTARA
jgi:hypothetical protein